jgi:hypothetical protein
MDLEPERMVATVVSAGVSY